MALINGEWVQGDAEAMQSINPATGELLWEGMASSASQVDAAIQAASQAFETWSLMPIEERIVYLERYRDLVAERKDELAELIAQEVGKTMWDASGEAGAVVSKVDISVKAYHDRTGSSIEAKTGFNQQLMHKPLGVMAVFAPYNFPVHLPGSHMIPALLAGNTIVLKPSEETPKVSEWMVKCWEETGLPAGVVNLVQGARDTGVALAGHPNAAGILFTGSYQTGRAIHQSLAGRPEIMLALEMGGNNPLVVHGAKDHEAAGLITILSAYITSGQRCTCARRLIVPEGAEGDAFIEILQEQVQRVQVGAYTDDPQPFMGPLINNTQAENTLMMQEQLAKQGGKILVESKRLRPDLPYISPGLIEVTAIENREDHECFGPLLQVVRVADMDGAIAEANNTAYGLSAGLISDDVELWKRFHAHIRAGLVNWNRQTTGATYALPFGGPGYSGNLRPSAYYAADYCAYPVASLTSEAVEKPEIVGLF